MDFIKQLLAKYATPLLSKWALRTLVYGTGALFAKWAVEIPDKDTLEKTAAWLAAVATTGIALLIDRLFHKFDKAH